MLTDNQLLVALYGLTESAKLIVPKLIDWMKNRDVQAKAESIAERAGLETARREESRAKIKSILDNTERLIDGSKDITRLREVLKELYGARDDLSKIKDKLDSTGPMSNQLDKLENMVGRVIDSLSTISIIQGEIRLLINRNDRG